MYSTLGVQLLPQQRIYHPMSRGLRFSLERVRDYDNPKMCFSRDATLHGFVVSVEVRVIVDFDKRRGE